jgi:hypothetical protein
MPSVIWLLRRRIELSDGVLLTIPLPQWDDQEKQNKGETAR